MITIALTPISTDHSIKCPWCAFPVAVVDAGGVGSTSDEVWLIDGDAIPPTKGYRDPAVGRDDMLFLGRCRACERHYYVVESSRLLAPQSVMDHNIASDGASVLLSSNHCDASNLPAGVPEKWICLNQHVDAIPLQTHLFGPFPLSDLGDVQGAHGVSPCQGRGGNAIWKGAADIISALDWQMTRMLREQAPVAAAGA